MAREPGRGLLEQLIADPEYLRLAHRSCNDVRGNDPIEETP
jgi:hypothetical protein